MLPCVFIREKSEMIWGVLLFYTSLLEKVVASKVYTEILVLPNPGVHLLHVANIKSIRIYIMKGKMSWEIGANCHDILTIEAAWRC